MTVFFPNASPPLLFLSASKPFQLDGAERATFPQQPPETLMRATGLIANMEQSSQILHCFQRNQDTATC